jgi:NitT/TauT family transport system substrate-binding protein
MPAITRRHALIGAAVLAASPAFGATQPSTRIRFTLDWKLQGQHAIFFLAREKGYFRDEGLDVIIDQGEGSAATITRVMSGAYDAGFGDINSVVEQAAKKPGEAPVTVYQFYNRPPYIIVVNKSSPIVKLKDFEGRTVGAPAGSAAARLIPVLAKRNGVDPAKISITNMQLSLQEQMLVQGQIDAMSTYNTTAYINLMMQGKDPDKDFRWFNFGDYGLDLYSNGVMVSQKFLKENPAAVGGLVRAVNRAVKDAAENIDAALAIIMKIEPLLNLAAERKRADYCFREVFISSETVANGFGDVDDKRLSRGIDIVVEAFELPRTPLAEEIFNHSFLPPKSDRMVSYKAS